MNNLPPSVRHLCARYRSQAGMTRQNSLETHDLSSLSQRLLLSPQETLEQVAAGNLLSLDSRNGKHLFSSRSLDVMRNRVVDFIAGEIVNEMSARGASEDRILFALSRAYQKQFDLSRGHGENIVEFAQTPADDDDDFYSNAKKAAGTAAGIGAAAGAGYLGYRGYQYLKGSNNGNGNTLPDGSPQPQLPPGPSGSGSGDVMGEKHPGPLPGDLDYRKVPLTTASPPRTIGEVLDPLTAAVKRGKTAIAQRGSAIWQAIRAMPIE